VVIVDVVWGRYGERDDQHGNSWSGVDRAGEYIVSDDFGTRTTGGATVITVYRA
jgi:hypothetical protein